MQSLTLTNRQPVHMNSHLVSSRNSDKRARADHLLRHLRQMVAFPSRSPGLAGHLPAELAKPRVKMAFVGFGYGALARWV